MSWEFVSIVAIFLLTIAILLWLARVSLRRRSVAGALPLAVTMLVAAGWTLTSLLEYLSADLSIRLFWAHASYFGIVAVPVAVLAFTVEYIGLGKWLTRRNLLLLSLEPILALFLVWTNDFHHLFWEYSRFSGEWPYLVLSEKHGPAFFIHGVYSYTLIALTMALLVRATFYLPRLYRHQSLAAVLGIAVASSASLANAFGFNPIPHIEIAPLAFALSGLLFSWGIYRYHLLDLTPMTRAAILENVSDGVMVLDGRNRILDLNPAAHKIIVFQNAAFRGQTIIGRRLEEVLPSLSNLILVEETELGREKVVQLQLKKEQCKFDVRISPLLDRDGKLTGRVAVLRNVTEQRQTEEALRRERDLTNAILDTSGALVVVLDREGRIVRFNRACEQVTGYTSAEVMEKCVWDFLLIPEEIEPVKAVFAALRSGVFPNQFENYWVSKNGERRLIAWSNTALPDQQGEIEYVIGAGLDVTERKQAELTLRESLARQQAIAEENATLFEYSQRKARELAALHAVSLDITSPHELSTLLETIVARAAQLLNAPGGGMYLCDPERKEARCMVSYNAPRDYRGTVLKYGEGAAGITAQTGKPLIIDDYRIWAGRAAVYEKEQPFVAVASAPMLWQGQVIGVLHVLQYTEDRKFTHHDLDLLTLFANQAAIAVENVRLFEAAQRRAQEAETLRQAGAVLAATLQQDEAIERILEQLERVVPYDSASVQLLREDALEIVGGKGWDDPSVVIGRRFLIPGENPNSLVIQQRSPHILADAPAVYPAFLQSPHSHIRSWLGVPLIVREQVMGMLALDSKLPNYFTPDHARLATAFASHVAMAIENAHLFTAEKRRAQELASLHTATTALLATLELDALLQQILRAAQCAIPKAQKGSLLLTDEKTGNLIVRAVVGYANPELLSMTYPVNTGYAAKAVRAKRPLLIHDVHTHPDIYYDGDIPEIQAIRSAIVVPLILGEQTLGAISLDSDRVGDLTESDLNLLISFAATATAAMRNAQLHSEVQRLAITDPLTGLYNRRGLFTLGEREIERYHRFGRPLAGIMLDIDHFKQVNDTYTHATGDQVLRVLANICQVHLRDIDIIGRYGGEEFAVLLPEADIPKSVQVAERLRAQVGKTTIKTGRGDISITISLGVAPASPETHDLASLLDYADRAMYTAKQTGRNRWTVIGDSPKIAI